MKKSVSTGNRTEYLRRAMLNAKGDDLERAQRFCRGKSDKEMNERIEISGKTPRQMLDGYVREREEWEKAVALLESLLTKAGL